jgi:hypothetical protein
MILVLAYFSNIPLRQERFIITMAFLGLAIVYWISCFISKGDDYNKIVRRIPSLDVVTPLAIVLMAITGTIEPLQQPIAPFSEIGIESIIRASITIGASVVLPGLLVLSLLGPNLRPLNQFIIAVYLSLVIIGLMTFGLYHTKANMSLMFPAIITTITLLWLTNLVKKYRSGKPLQMLCSISPEQTTINHWNICFGLMVLALIAIGFLFHTSQPYMIPGDAWRVVQPGVDLIAGRDISQTALAGLEYPITFGFLMAGISQIAGIPIVNTNMFLFPLLGLNLLSFYAMVRHVFRTGRAVATTASLMYGFTGGLGWLMGQILGFKTDFWTLSYRTQDMLFSYYFLDNIQFWHRTLAVTFGFMAILTFSLAMTKVARVRWLLLALSATFMIFAFFVHMLPLVFVVPVIGYLWFTKGKRSKAIFLAYVMITFIVFIACDALLNNYYSSLTLIKINKELLPKVGAANLSSDVINMGLATTGGLAITGFVLKMVRNHRRKINRATAVEETISDAIPNPNNVLSFSTENRSLEATENRSLEAKILRFSSPSLFGLVMIGIYIYGIVLWSTFPPDQGLLYDINRLPWYFLPIRFGIVGLLALATLFFVNEKRYWMGLCLTWLLVVFIIGNIWWGPKILSFSFPVIAFLAGVALHGMKNNASEIKRIFRLQDPSHKVVKVAVLTAIGGLLVLSTSSYVFGLSHYIINESNDHTIPDIVSWIYSNIPRNEKVIIYDSDHNLEVGLSSLSAHETLLPKDLKDFDKMSINEIRDSGFNYFVGKDPELPRVIEGDAFPVYRTGNITVFWLVSTFSSKNAHAMNLGSGTSETGQESDSSYLDKKWKITWQEKVGTTLSLEQEIPKGSKLSFDINLTQSSWNTPSSIQELDANFFKDKSQVQTRNLLNDLNPDTSNKVVIFLDSEVDRIEFGAMNGGTNNAIMSIRDLRYLTPQGELIRLMLS